MTFPGGMRHKVFSSAFEITLKSCLHFIQPNPGGVGLILPALGAHRSRFSSGRSPEQCDPYRELQQRSSLKDLKDQVTHWQDSAFWWEKFALVLKPREMSQDRFPAAWCQLPAARSGSTAASTGAVCRIHTEDTRRNRSGTFLICSFQGWTENYDQKVKLSRCVLKLAEELAGIRSFWALRTELHLGITWASQHKRGVQDRLRPVYSKGSYGLKPLH